MGNTSNKLQIAANRLAFCENSRDESAESLNTFTTIWPIIMASGGKQGNK